MTAGKPATGPFTPTERLIITVPVLLAALLHSVSQTTAYIALPNMKGNLSATPDQIGWVITSFMVASAIATAGTGWLAVRFGRKAIFLAAICGFSLASLLCAAATTIEELVFYRFIQGALSAPIMPLSQAIMLDTYPPQRHAFAMSIWSLGMILGPVAGPTLGAWLTEEYDWRWVFYINVPLGIAGFIGVLLTVPEAARIARRLDWIGLATISLAVGAFQLFLDRGHREDWFQSIEITVAASVASLALYLFLAHTLTTRDPFLNLAVFRDRNFVIGLLLVAIFALSLFATLLLVPLFLQEIQGYPVLSAGVIVSSRGLGTMVGMLFMTTRLGTRMDPRWLIAVGLCTTAATTWRMTGWTHQVSVEEVIAANAIGGVAMGWIWVAITTVTFSTLAGALRTEGAALFALTRAITASIGISISVVVLTHTTEVTYTELTWRLTPFNEAWVRLGDDHYWTKETQKGLMRFRSEMARQAELIAFNNDFKLLTLVALAGIPLVFLVRRKAPEVAVPAPRTEARSAGD